MIKNIKSKVVLTLLIAVIVLFLYFSGIGCVYRYFFNIPCPGCGMTRAVLCLLKLDFKGAFEYNYMVYSLPVVYALFLTEGKLFKKRLLNYIIMFLIGTLFLIRYIFILWR